MPDTDDTASLPKKSWRDFIKVHPAAELFPMMSEDELKELGEDIKANGLKQDITFFDDGLGGLSVLDGRNRLDAMELAGYRFLLSYSAVREPSKTLRAEGPDGKVALVHMRHEYKDPWGFAVSANLYRRQLTTAQRREVAATLLKVDPERSNRAIAEQVKLDKNTVQDVRHELEASGEIHQSETRVSATGQKRKAAKKSAPRVNPEPAEPMAEPPNEVPKAKPLPYAERPVIKEFFRLYQDVMDGGERLYAYAELQKSVG